MKRSHLFTLTGGCVGAVIVLSSTSASSGQSSAFVRLQALSPIVTQTGSASITGRFSAGSLRVGQTAVPGNVFTATENGVGVWLPPTSLMMPFSKVLSSDSDLFALSNTGTGTAMFGRTASATNPAIYGVSDSPSGTSAGLLGESNSEYGNGVRAVNMEGVALSAVSREGTGLIAIGKNGIRGEALRNGTDSAGWGTGVYGSSGNLNGIGVHGVVSHRSGAYGVYGLSTAGNCWGVLGISNGTGITTGIQGVSQGNGCGVVGIGQPTTGDACGGYFKTYTAGGYGLWAIGGQYAVFAEGNTATSGTKSFCIDHPLDPENKVLRHFCSESPEPQNFYNGIVRTDKGGEAWVELPSYFEAINKDFKYTLTIVEDDDTEVFAQAKIARKISGNRFKIRTSLPLMEVSWRVDATRNDRWGQKHPPITEEEKPEMKRGRLYQPELYGYPNSHSISSTYVKPLPSSNQRHQTP